MWAQISNFHKVLFFFVKLIGDEKQIKHVDQLSANKADPEGGILHNTKWPLHAEWLWSSVIRVGNWLYYNVGLLYQENWPETWFTQFLNP